MLTSIVEDNWLIGSHGRRLVAGACLVMPLVPLRCADEDERVSLSRVDMQKIGYAGKAASGCEVSRRARREDACASRLHVRFMETLGGSPGKPAQGPKETAVSQVLGQDLLVYARPML